MAGSRKSAYRVVSTSERKLTMGVYFLFSFSGNPDFLNYEGKFDSYLIPKIHYKKTKQNTQENFFIHNFETQKYKTVKFSLLLLPFSCYLIQIWKSEGLYSV